VWLLHCLTIGLLHLFDWGVGGQWEAYGQSKLANILHAAELDKRVQGLGIRAYSCE
jgi:NAD(P)-dependent dehydrogenase (short-subunit alcohol dehydrogenase family)